MVPYLKKNFQHSDPYLNGAYGLQLVLYANATAILVSIERRSTHTRCKEKLGWPVASKYSTLADEYVE